MIDRKKQCQEKRRKRRADRINLFLKRHGWGDAARTPLADDASFRRYDRLRRGNERAVLMDAPPEFEDVRPFMAIARHLHGLGLAAPEIMASDVEDGFLLLEDMGDDLFSRVVEHDPEQEIPLYLMATKGLLALHGATPPPGIARYDVDMLLREASLFVDWYLPALGGKCLREADRNGFLNICRDILSPVCRDLTCLTLRDYHADNLMLRAGQEGLARLGLLDFQDAVSGHPAYDLVSLLQDARRDVSAWVEQEMLEFYMGETGQDETIFRRDYAILGAQRHMKIIGIFTRLYLRDGKEAYLEKIPRVWGLLERDLRHPSLSVLKDWLAGHVDHSLRQMKFIPENFMPPWAMILAAGLGMRMRPLSEACPKPLIKVAGKELISTTLDGLCAAGVRHVMVNIHYLADQMADYLDDYYDPRLVIDQSDERAQLMDSGGGVKQAQKYMEKYREKYMEKYRGKNLGNAPFFVLNSDMIWQDGSQFMLHRLQAFWQSDKMDILMLLLPREAAFGYDGIGDFHRDGDGRLTARGTDEGADFVYGGIMIIRPECFDDAPEAPFSLRRQFTTAAQKGRLFGIIHDGPWYHVGSPGLRDQLEAILGDNLQCPEC